MPGGQVQLHAVDFATSPKLLVPSFAAMFVSLRNAMGTARFRAPGGMCHMDSRAAEAASAASLNIRTV